MFMILFAFILLSCPFHSIAQCDNILNANSCTFLDELSNNTVSISTDERSCVRFPAYCCWNGTLCYNKELITAKEVKNVNSTEEDQLPFEYPIIEEEVESGNDSSRRTLSLECLPLPTFPKSCKIARDEPYVQHPPIDIPYCKRIPCSSDKGNQTELDKNHLECGSTPGCYFDVELFRLRQQVSSSILAGVPVCHFAIRKPAFLEKAQIVVNTYGYWNPFFTNCLLNTFKSELEVDHPGCNVIPALQTFKVAPKLKGWKTINPSECRMIDGCWRTGEGCFAPVDPENVSIKSAQEIGVNPFGIKYGRSRCQLFNTANSYEVLRSFHRCSSAGCSVDNLIMDFYYIHLFNIGYQMSVKDHQRYWQDVQQGKISTISDLHFMSYKRNVSMATSPINGLKKCGSRATRPCQPLGPPPAFFGHNACPFNPPNIPLNMKPLRGTFKGCCDIDICYQPKAKIVSSRSGVAPYYTGWSFFSPCSAACGLGTQKRFRKCASHDPSLCTESLEDSIPCHHKPCGNWGKWGCWGKCRGKPGRRFRRRTRKCIPKGAVCTGRTAIRRRC